MVEVEPIICIALEVISGKYGVGEERIKNLQREGYDASVVQSCVNDLIALAKKYGYGD